MERVNEILERTQTISPNEEDFKEQLEGETIESVHIGERGDKIHLELESGEHVEIGTEAPAKMNPYVVTEQNVSI